MGMIVPVNSTGDRRFQVLLGDNLLSIRTYYNPLIPLWHMDIYDSNGQAFITGQPLIPVINLLEAYPDLTRQLGQFRLITTGDYQSETALGDTAVLWWFTDAEARSFIPELTTIGELSIDVRSLYTIPEPPPPTQPVIINDSIILGA